MSVSQPATGNPPSEAENLDLHFLFSHSGHEAMVRAVGFQPGWRVLDAGCGVGSSLPLIAELVGADGTIGALDLAPENIAIVEARLKARPVACAVEARVGSVLALPYADRAFDAVWNANVSQYLSDDALRAMFAEARRVVRPGGLVAIKEFDATGWQCSFVTPFMWWHLFEAESRRGDTQARGQLRAVELPRWFRSAGLTDIRSQHFIVEKNGPLPAHDRAFVANLYLLNRARALTLDLPPADLDAWRALSDPRALDEAAGRPDFFVREEHILIVGRVP